MYSVHRVGQADAAPGLGELADGGADQGGVLGDAADHPGQGLHLRHLGGVRGGGGRGEGGEC